MMKDNWTLEEIKEELSKIFYGRKTEDRKVILHQRCFTYGWVSRGDVNDQICDDPECISCREWSGMIREAASEFLTNDGNFLKNG